MIVDLSCFEIIHNNVIIKILSCCLVAIISVVTARALISASGIFVIVFSYHQGSQLKQFSKTQINFIQIITCQHNTPIK